MRKSMITGTAVALSLAVAGTAQASVPTGQSHAGDRSASHGKIITHKVCKLSQGKKNCRFVKVKLKKVSNGVNGTNGTNGSNGAQGVNGDTGARGPQGIAGRNGLNGVSGYEVATYNYDNVGPGGVATVACSSQDKVAVSGGFYVRNPQSDNMGTNMPALSNGAGIVASFPGRMDWNTNTPKPNRNDGWIIRFNDKPAGVVTLYAVCINAA